MAEIHEIERNPEFEAYLPLFKQGQSEPVFPEFSEDWLNRSPNIQLEGTTMLATEVKKETKKLPYLAAAAAVLFVLSGLFFLFLQKGPVAPVASYTGKLKAVVVFIKGDARRIEGTAKTTLHTGDILKAGTILETGGDAIVDLSLEGGSIVRVRNNTRIVLATPREPEKGVLIEQGNGQTVHVIRKLDVAAQHAAISPTAVASVRGTIFEFFVEPAGSTITVAEGKVEATGLKGRTETHVIEANHSIRLTDEKDKPTSQDASQLLTEAAEMKEHAAAFEDASAMTGEIKEANTEAELKEIYQQEIELVTLADGRVLRGVVVAQSGGKLLVQTVGGSFFVNESEVRSIRYATGPQ